jgi:hypothetical protein
MHDTHKTTDNRSHLSKICTVSGCEENLKLLCGKLIGEERIENVVYYEWIKRELKIKPIYECRCDERPQTKTKRFTRLSYTGLVLELEHVKIKTRLTNEKFVSVKGECEI